MSLMKRMLSSIGIGSAKVDTVLLGDRFAPGDVIDATVKIRGGEVEQKVDDLYFSIHSTYEVETDDGKVTRTASFGTYKLTEAFVIGPGEEKGIPVNIRLPLDTPLSMGATRVWIRTGLDIKGAVDPGDKDYIEVVPGRLVGELFNALHQLGFALVQAECEETPTKGWGRRPFAQEFEFKPVGGPFRGKLDELEIVCFPSEDFVEVFMEIDRRARGVGSFLAEMMNLDESRTKFTFSAQDLSGLPDRLRRFIEQWA